MKHRSLSRLMLTAALLALLAPALVRAQAPAKAPFEFFPLDNGVGRGVWSPAQQAETVKEVGFDGIGYNYTTPQALQSWLKELAPRGMKLYSIYFPVALDKPEPYPAGLKQAIGILKGSDTVLWIIIPKPKGQGDWDAVAVKRVQALADEAAANGLRVVIYPHYGLYVATAEDALRIAKQVKAQNLGVTVNLCHELASGNGPRLKEIIREAAPSLKLVTICGATDKKDPKNTWANYIQPLDKGEYDVFGLLQTLREVGYRGPVGLQCFSVKGDQKENLQRSMGAWKKYMSRLAAKEQ